MKCYNSFQVIGPFKKRTYLRRAFLTGKPLKHLAGESVGRHRSASARGGRR